MKKALTILTLALLMVSCKSEPKSDLAPDTFQINVSAKGVYNGMRAYLKPYKQTRRGQALDTAIVMNGQFIMDGSIKTPGFYRVTIDGVKGELDLILEPGTIDVELYKDSIQMSKISGTALNNTFNNYKNTLSKKGKVLKELRAEIKTIPKTDSTAIADIRKTYNTLNAELKSYHFKFIEENASSEFALIFLESICASKTHSLDDIKNSFKQLAGIASKNDYTKKIAAKIQQQINIREGAENSEIGKVAPDFSAPTPDGEMLSLNAIKGKATIIDFWASWCRPCRIENPNVVKVYEKYHDKGLEIISVSLDKSGQKERWLKAIEDDNLQWHHVSNLKFWNEPVARMYNVTSIPATFILDADGKIVAKKLRGEALENKIAELLD